MIPLASIQRVAKKAGVKRISNLALKELQLSLDDIGMEIVRETSELTKHDKRKTIMKDDILIVSKKK